MTGKRVHTDEEKKAIRIKAIESSDLTRLPYAALAFIFDYYLTSDVDAKVDVLLAEIVRLREKRHNYDEDRYEQVVPKEVTPTPPNPSSEP